MSEHVVDQLDSDLNPAPKMLPYALRFGLIAALVTCIFSLVVYFIGQEYNRSLQWVGMIFPIAGVILALKAFKKDNYYSLRGGQGFKLGMLFFVIYAGVTTLYTLLFVTVINPEYMDGWREITINQLEDRGLSDEMIDQQMAISNMFFKTPAVLMIGIVTNLFFGAIISGIASAVMKTPKK
jgi:hypothetical protein